MKADLSALCSPVRRPLRVTFMMFMMMTMMMFMMMTMMFMMKMMMTHIFNSYITNCVFGELVKVDTNLKTAVVIIHSCRQFCKTDTPVTSDLSFSGECCP